MRALIQRALQQRTGILEKPVSRTHALVQASKIQQEKALNRILINARLAKKQHKFDLNLRNVILLDSESDVDLFCNKALCESIYKVDKRLSVSGNGGKLIATHKSKVPDYKFHPWYEKKAI